MNTYKTVGHTGFARLCCNQWITRTRSPRLYAWHRWWEYVTNNDSAKYCYKSVGFQPVGKTEIYKMPIGEWECMEMTVE